MHVPTETSDRFPAHMAGVFETHVTVRTDDVDGLARRAGAYGVGLTHIVLARGRTVSQPMLTERATTTLHRARERAAELRVALHGDGFTVTRTKIEAAPWHPGVPRTDAEAHALGPELYFEHHVKLILAPDIDLDALAAEVAPHGAHLSRNARRLRADGRTERYVTQRCHRVGDRAAAQASALLVDALGKHEIASIEREFVVFDDNGTLDDGWIEGETDR
ncbi:hypothetical protein [Embleya sp. NBC_00896]|uniref:hypothetical protein n=1 Tax=Embleya sp. NBC_00896 TaxID=2975961 RepID=UPI00386DE72B|nr:hypothetical protein OG928_27520 [Embleya sp. NBC_00896]